MCLRCFKNHQISACFVKSETDAYGKNFFLNIFQVIFDKVFWLGNFLEIVNRWECFKSF